MTAAAHIQRLAIPAFEATVHRGLDYGAGPRHRLDVYAPKNAENAPIVVFLYGGSWKSGTRDLYRFVGASLAKAGFLTAIPDYRLHPEVGFPAFLDDAAHAFAWTVREAPGLGGRPGPALLMGHSAGAHMAALLIADPAYLGAAEVAPDRVAGFVGLSGPYTFDPAREESVKAVFEGTEPMDRARPHRLIDGPTPPMLLTHGLADRTVYPSNTTGFAKRVRALGGQVKTVLIPRMNHEGGVLDLAWPARWRSGLRREVLAFARGIFEAV